MKGPQQRVLRCQLYGAACVALEVVAGTFKYRRFILKVRILEGILAL